MTLHVLEPTFEEGCSRLRPRPPARGARGRHRRHHLERQEGDRPLLRPHRDPPSHPVRGGGGGAPDQEELQRPGRAGPHGGDGGVERGDRRGRGLRELLVVQSARRDPHRAARGSRDRDHDRPVRDRGGRDAAGARRPRLSLRGDGAPDQQRFGHGTRATGGGGPRAEPGADPSRRRVRAPSGATPARHPARSRGSPWNARRPQPGLLSDYASLIRPTIGPHFRPAPGRFVGRIGEAQCDNRKPPIRRP